MMRHRWQFSLYGLLVVMTAAAIYFALVARSPWLAAAAGFWLLVLYTADLLVAVGATPAGARAIVLMTVVAWFLAGTLLMAMAAFLLAMAYGSQISPLGATPWLIVVAPSAIGGLACLIAARNASRNGPGGR